jgi:hypothetical protein
MDTVVRGGRTVDDMLIQEVDVTTGRLTWEWRATDHIALDESVEPIPDEGPWDHVHFNSIDRDGEHGLLVSARHTNAIYRIDRRTGRIDWRLGGRRSDLALPPDAVFAAQHDARRLADGSLSLFDNATTDPEATGARSRGLVLRLDPDAGRASVVRELRPPRPAISSSQGNLTVRPDGTAVIGWGSARLVTAYAADGQVLVDAAMPPGFSSYRAFLAPWSARPADQPIVHVAAAEDGSPAAWVSWNGATDVARWQLVSGDTPGALRPAGPPVARTGFETRLPVPVDAAVVAVHALDGQGRQLAAARPITVDAALAEAARS